jgi:hypothetical protein
MAAHAILADTTSSAPRCVPGSGSAQERDADWLGGLIVMPRELLRTKFLEAAMRYGARLDTVRAEGRLPAGELIPRALHSALLEVASYFNVPIWLGTLHIADAGLLDFAYGQVTR